MELFSRAMGGFIGVRVVYDSIATHHPPKSHIKNATTSSTTQNCSMATANALGVI